jgi:TonB family protein
MMRKVTMASLALFPMLLHAQANSPAQPMTSSTSVILESELVEPQTLAGEDGNPNATAPVRVSTGVVAPKLTHTVGISTEGDLAWKAIPTDRTAVVEMVVDATGKPSNLKIVDSVDPALDRNVLDAVSQYRFTPGTLDNQPADVPVTLHILMHNTEH